MCELLNQSVKKSERKVRNMDQEEQFPLMVETERCERVIRVRLDAPPDDDDDDEEDEGIVITCKEGKKMVRQVKRN